jgi:hypothetical protein
MIKLTVSTRLATGEARAIVPKRVIMGNDLIIEEYIVIIVQVKRA